MVVFLISHLSSGIFYFVCTVFSLLLTGVALGFGLPIHNITESHSSLSTAVTFNFIKFSDHEVMVGTIRDGQFNCFSNKKFVKNGDALTQKYSHYPCEWLKYLIFTRLSKNVINSQNGALKWTTRSVTCTAKSSERKRA